jgi:two-component system cell cycle sensor histidine kinase/response regulator CckA
VLAREGRRVFMRTFTEAPIASAASAGAREASLPEMDRRQTHKLETLGRLTCGVAHDFNNLLTIISGYSQLLLARGGPGHEMRQELLQIQQATERAATFIRQLLYFSSKKDCRREPADLNALVTEHARTLQPLLGEGVELHLVLSDGLPAIEVNPGQLLQILLNLTANARDAMPHGGRLTLTTALVSKSLQSQSGPRTAGSKIDGASSDLVAGGRAEATFGLPAVPVPSNGEAVEVLLRVSDTGCGMDQQVVARLFEPFFTTKPFGAGTGLGLVSVAENVKQMQGRIEVESAPGQGSAFTMLFPPAPGLQPSPTGLPDRYGALAGHETILVVEDAEYVRLLLERVLSMNGYTVLAAANGHDAIKLAEQAAHPIDLLITDVVMPRMSGKQVAEALAVLHYGIRVLYVSGYTATVLDEPVVLEDGEAFLQKPFTPELLLLKVREVLGHAPA